MSPGAATTYAEAMQQGRAVLQEAGRESAALDARLLMAAAAGLDTAVLIARSRHAVPPLVIETFRSHVARRAAGEPVARILGQKEFWGLPFKLGEAALVPRPETEFLVQAVLDEARRRFPPDLSICDLGTGSGAVLIALLRELPDASGVATDISAAALATARDNAERLGVAARISFLQMEFAQGPDGPFDIVVSNPPYIPSASIAALPPEVREHDPRRALDGGPDGLSAYRDILRRTPALLAGRGALALEVGHGQAAAVAALCRAAGLGEVAVRDDLAGIPRVVLGQYLKSDSRRAGSKKALGNVGVSG